MTISIPCRRRPRPIHWALVALLLGSMLAGCHTGPGNPHSAGASLPLEARNATNDTVTVRLRVYDAERTSTLYDEAFDLGPGGRRAIDRLELPSGDYRVEASTDDLQREARISFGPEDLYFRFVIYDDIIAYQHK